MRTFSAKPNQVEPRWWVVDATDIPLGRLASRVAMVLRGKHRPEYTPHVDTGDFVIVVNADRVKLTGGKPFTKIDYRYSGSMGGLKAMAYKDVLEQKPEYAVEKAVRGMLPKNSLGRKIGKKLKVYRGGEHPHEAQQPAPLALS
ncbi:MAG TPA: 50S ribosomal protein L13 [Polyangiaceae bacterium LLY-WYZ-14_1]|nr:50S ribosomal protein L13 [Polyangiaceae bacterium LLY-WYZ-14_1]